VSPPSFPQTVPRSGAFLPSTGSLGSVPPLPRYCEALRLPAALPASLRFLRCAVPPCASCFAPANVRRTVRRPGVVHRIPHHRFIEGGDRTSQVPAGPTMNVPCSPTPAGPLCSATAALRCCLPPFGRRRLPRLPNISRLNHTARSFAVYASQGELPQRHARLASGGWPTLPGGTGYPPGPNERFQVIPSSFPKLCLAHPNNSESDSWIASVRPRRPDHESAWYPHMG
jgi:hypothetical protein